MSIAREKLSGTYTRLKSPQSKSVREDALEIQDKGARSRMGMVCG